MAERALLYCRQDEMQAAGEWVAGRDETILVRNARYHDGQAEACTRLYVTPAAEFVAADYGVPCEVVRFGEAPEYTVEQSGTWYKLIGPDGEQVGKSQRSESAAWRELEGTDGASTE